MTKTKIKFTRIGKHAFNKHKYGNVTLLTSDLNARTQGRLEGEDETIGDRCFDKSSVGIKAIRQVKDKRDMLIGFCLESNFEIMNTSFPQQEKPKTT